jgi:hypothetical protein
MSGKPIQNMEGIMKDSEIEGQFRTINDQLIRIYRHLDVIYDMSKKMDAIVDYLGIDFEVTPPSPEKLRAVKKAVKK